MSEDFGLRWDMGLVTRVQALLLDNRAATIRLELRQFLEKWEGRDD